jgi:hypothetical protein
MSNSLSAISVPQLKQAIRIKKQIESLSSQLVRLLGSSAGTISASGARKGGISAAGRAAIRAAQKARWAKVKGKRRGKRKMSAAGRAKIAAAAKARWKAAKAAGKTRL